MENEGWDVARALADRGVAAFVLKYRLNPTPADMPGFEKSMRDLFSANARPPRLDPNPAMTAIAPQPAESRPAFAPVRRRPSQAPDSPPPDSHGGFSPRRPPHTGNA